MIIGVGTDITDTDRIKKALEINRFRERFYTPSELDYIENRKNKAESASGIFAAKEAVVKALGTGFSGIGFHDIEILHEESGKPYVNLKNKNDIIIHISISHEKKYATAFAVAEKR